VQSVFGPFRLDLDTRQLLGPGGGIHLSPKAFDLLAALVFERPKVLSKNALLQRLWPDTFVAEANLSNLIAEIREALDDRARAPRYIRTLHRVGYAFFADATDGPSAPPSRPPEYWLQWGERRFPLTPGIHVIGRDPDVAVRLDGATVSRRHAQLNVTTGGAVLEDSGSKNGTFVRGARLTAPVALNDGDEIRIGSVLVTFHAQASFASTETQIVGPVPIV
jgi:DNA-binding winged helix-turn-helix (wHTH) protein